MATTSRPHSPTPNLNSRLSMSSSNHAASTTSTCSPKTSNEPFSNTFFSKDPKMAAARAIFFKIFISGAFFVVLVIFCVLSIYWGALWKAPAHNLPGWIVDFDNSLIGQTVTHSLAGSLLPKGRISWTVVPASNFPNGIGELANAVVEEECWVAVAINKGATARLNTAVTTANASYDGTTAITVFAVEARNENAYRSFIRPSVEPALQLIAHQFALNFAKSLSSSPNTTTTLLSTAPQILVQPFYYTLSNLRPFDVPVASAVTFVGLIYLLILAFFVVMIGNSARQIAKLDSMLTLPSLIRLRLISTTITYFFISLFYSLLSLAFQLPFDRKFGQAGFMVFWMLNWIGMLAVGLALESLITLLTPRFLPFFMILWIIANVSVCFLPIPVLPRIFHYGYATPFYSVSRAVRTIVFGTKNSVGLDFSILLVWVAISCVSLPLIQRFVRGREVMAWRKREEDEKVGI